MRAPWMLWRVWRYLFRSRPVLTVELNGDGTCARDYEEAA